MWEWEGDSSGSWHAYDMELATFLEAMQQQGQTILNLSTSQFRLPYYINFSTMQQVLSFMLLVFEDAFILFSSLLALWMVVDF